MPWVSGFSGWVLATLVFIVAIIMVVGAAAWVWGKMENSQRAQSAGIVGFAVGAAGAALIAVAGAAIEWAGGLGPNW